MGCSRRQLGSTLLGLGGTRQNVPRDVATEGWRGGGINAVTLVAFGYRSPQETLNSSCCNLTRKLSDAREKVARNDVGAEWHRSWGEKLSVVGAVRSGCRWVKGGWGGAPTVLWGEKLSVVGAVCSSCRWVKAGWGGAPTVLRHTNDPWRFIFIRRVGLLCGQKRSFPFSP